MTLNSLSTKWFEATGSVVGFVFKSTVTGKVFKAVSKTDGGKYLCVINDGTKESLLDGTVDRYTMFGGSSRIAEINALLGKLENEREAIEQKIEALENEMDEVSNVG